MPGFSQQNQENHRLPYGCWLLTHMTVSRVPYGLGRKPFGLTDVAFDEAKDRRFL